MNPNNNIEARLAALEKWRAEKERQQISFPLDFQSINVLKRDFMRIMSTITTIGGAGGNTFIEYAGEQGDLKFIVNKNTYVPYTVNVTSNVFTVTSTYFEDDMQVFVATSDTAPAPLAADGTAYYVISSTGTTFKLSATQGGAEINITDSGTGSQYFYFF